MKQNDFIGRVPVTPIVDTDDAPDLRGRWIQNPLFFKYGYRESRPAARNAQTASELTNIHTFYRREVTLKNRPIASAVLRVTADDTVRLYVNGDFALLGPAQALPCGYFYQIYDVTDALNRRPGALTLAAHVYYFGEYGFSYISADNLEGLWLQLDLTYDDGSRQRVVTDADWHYMTSTAWRGVNLYGYVTQFSEEITLSAIPDGWQAPGFDDSAWDMAVVRGVPYPMAYNLHPQPTPPLEIAYREPASAVVLEDGATLLDMGGEVVGCTELLCGGQEKIVIRHAEELLPNGHARYRMRANCVYEDEIIPDGRTGPAALFEPKGFRYIELCPPFVYTPGCLRVMTLHYPFTQVGEMSCGDRGFEEIWALCRNGVRVGTQDTYFDCPTREKGGFTGDAYITAFSHLLLTGDARILRKLLLDIAVSERMDPWQSDVVPGYLSGGLTDYALLIPSMLARYYDATADLGTVRALAWMLDNLGEVMRGFEDNHGLLSAPYSVLDNGHYTTLIDWPVNLLNGYDLDGAKKGASPVLNAFYVGFLRESARLYALCGEEEAAEASLTRADTVQTAMEEYLFDPVRGLFRDHADSDRCSLHGQAPALCFGVDFPGGAEAALTLIRETGLHCGVYFSYFVLRGLYRQGRYEDAWRLMNNDSEYGWREMLRAGATTCMEVWSPDQKWNTSFCHPWSSCPVILWAEEVCGLTAAAPGWMAVRFAPRVPAGLASGSVTVPIPAKDGKVTDKVSVGFVREDGGVTYTLTMTRGAELVLSLLSPCILVDGQAVPLTGTVRDTMTAYEGRVRLEAGTHRIQETAGDMVSPNT